MLCLLQIEDELVKSNMERATSQRKQHESQAKEIELFDGETRSMGIDPVEIYTADNDFRQILDDGDDCSLSLRPPGLSASSSTASFNTQL